MVDSDLASPGSDGNPSGLEILHDGLLLEGLVMVRRGSVASGYLPLRQGTTVLYGLNGSGKTSVLASLQAALTGFKTEGAGRSQLLVQVRDDDDASEFIRDVLTSARFEQYQDLAAAIDEAVFTMLSGRQPLDSEAIASEFAAQKRLLVRDGFDGGSGGWFVSVGAVLDGSTPRLTSLMRLLTTLHAKLDSFDDNNEESIRQTLGLFRREIPDDDLELWDAASTLVAAFPLQPVFGWASLSDLTSGLPALVECDLYGWGAAATVFLPDLMLESATAAELNLKLRETIAMPYTGPPADIPPPVVDADTALPSIVAQCEALSAVATAELQRFLDTDLELRALVRRPREWLLHAPVEWVALKPKGVHVSLDALSRAELRWSKVAIAVAMLPLDPALATFGVALPRAPRFRIFDEPESALHRTAEARMARSLLASDPSKWVTVVATHSPELLDSAANVVLLDPRPEGVNSLRPWSNEQLDDLDCLGLRRSELLGRYKFMLAVEGPHDRWILEELLRDDFERLRVVVVAMFGGKETPGLGTAGVLHEFTDWVMVPVWDNLHAEQLAQAWSDVQAAVAAGATTDEVRNVAAAVLRGSSEAKFARQFMVQTAISRQWHRCAQPFGMSESDILHYLPPRALSPKLPPTWDDVAAAQAAAGDKDEKAFLRGSRFRLSLDEVEIRTAARSMDHRPKDFTALVAYLERLATSRTW